MHNMQDNWMKPLIQDLREKAEKQFPRQDGDYTNAEDGLLYCGKCHTPKQVRLSNLPKYGMLAGTVNPCMCACEHEKLQREEAERRRRNLVPELLDRCFGQESENLRLQTFENDKGYTPALMEQARRYFRMITDENAPENLRNVGLLICGSVGCGKSYAACAILNAIICEKCWSCQMIKLKTVVNKLWNHSDREGYIERLTSARILYIDDLREEYLKEGKSELVYDLLERRQESGKPVIVTTNIPRQVFYRQNLPNDLQRIYSRLVGMCIPIEVVSEDIRRKKAAESMNAYAAYQQRSQI